MGVTCFILLSGYFGIRFDFKKLIRLDLMIIFSQYLVRSQLEIWV